MLSGLEADRTRIADLDAQISHLECSLSALREEKTLAQERLDSYKYPVLTLPNEIVSDIFMHFLPTWPYSHFPPLTGLFSPTLLTHICRRWREIALGTPALWTAIGSSRDGVPSEIKAHIFDLWLKRSRLSPLSVQIVDRDHRMDVAEILAAVVPHRARWEHLELYLPPSHLPNIINGPMPLLRHLDLALNIYPGTDILAFREVPLLRTAVLNGAAASSIILPWAQLTSLTLTNVYPRACAPILQQTSNLVRCELQVYSGNAQPGPDIALPYLESLVIFDQEGPVTGFLETFIVPALRRLEIPNRFLGRSPITSLTEFISKSGCKLEEVHITGTRSLPKRSYHMAFPSIHKFSFDDKEDSSESDALGIKDNSVSE
ncbi:hypothetical protein B0H13DRAFT_2281454 [Mycena leptocephala]|nr:hypothetical protein B0H13DRAFT_2281454 [Mycena leptocephala]